MQCCLSDLGILQAMPEAWAPEGSPQAGPAYQNFLRGDVGPEDREAFEMHVLKVAPCPKRYIHDWSTCPFAHAGERARRRCPHTYNYTAIACLSMKQGSCALGDACPFAHSAFEYWLHPTRYHTALCKQGPTCQRKICFFAHHPSELRTPAKRPGAPLAGSASTCTSTGTAVPLQQGASPTHSAQSGCSISGPLQLAGCGLRGGSPRSSLELAGEVGGVAAPGFSSLLPGGSAAAAFCPEPALLFNTQGDMWVPSPPPPSVLVAPTMTSLDCRGLSVLPTVASAQPQPSAGQIAFTDTTARALIQAVAQELQAGRMDSAQAANILGGILPSGQAQMAQAVQAKRTQAELLTLALVRARALDM